MRCWLIAIVGAASVFCVGQDETRTSASTPAVPPELLQRPYLYEVTRHLYRWYLDEGDLDPLAATQAVEFWVRALHPALDDGDRSRFAEVLLPQLRISARVKCADYSIPELAVTVRSDTFKIVGVSRVTLEDSPPADCLLLKVPYAEMREHLFRTRRDSRFPEGELLLRLRRATRNELLKDVARRAADTPTGTQIVHLAPLSPVANETWIFWETGRRLIRFASDIDLADPAVWEHEELAVRLFDVDEQVVVSLDEVAGSNAYLTRDQVGRALYNCVVLGRRLELQPLTNAERAIREQESGAPGRPSDAMGSD